MSSSACPRPPRPSRMRRCHQAGYVALAVVVAFVASTWSGQEDSSGAVIQHAAEDPWLSPKAALVHVVGPPAQGWTLARAVDDGQQWMKVYTKLEPGWLSMRVDATVFGTVTEIMSILREIDLMHMWNPFCDHGELLRLLSFSEIWAAAGVHLPWPVPRQYLFVRASVRKDPTAHGGLVAIAQSQKDGEIEPPKGTKLPQALSSRVHLAVHLAVARLRPGKVGPSASPPMTQGEIYITFDLSRVPGLTAVSKPPSYLVNLIVWICVPTIWTEYLAAIAQISQPSSAHLRRIQQDATGLYKWMARRTGQPLSSSSRSDAPRLVHQGATGPRRKPWNWWRGKDHS